MVNRVFNKQDFLEQLKTNFFMQLDGAQEQLTLIEVSSLNSDTVESGQKEPFSLVFESHSTTVYQQGVYQFTQASLGDLEIFLVPIGADENSVKYEAVFT